MVAALVDTLLSEVDVVDELEQLRKIYRIISAETLNVITESIAKTHLSLSRHGDYNKVFHNQLSLT